MKHALVPAALIAVAVLGTVLWLALRDGGDALPSAPPTVAPALERTADPTELVEPRDLGGLVRESRAQADAPPPAIQQLAATETQPAVPPSTAKGPGGPGAIAVTVLGPAGQPVTGARVTVESSELPPLRRTGALSPRTAVTGADGKASVEALPLGDYRAVARASELAANAGAAVRLTAARPTAELDIELTEGGSVAGELMDVKGNPAAGIQLSIHLKAWPDQAREGVTTFLKQTTAGEDGAFRFDHLPAGRYMLYTRAKAADKQRVPDQRIDLEVLEGQTTEVAFEDLRGSFVELTGVVLRDGAPVPEANITLHWAERGRGFLGRKAKTDADGRFVLILDEPGLYRFQINDRKIGGSVFHVETVPPGPACDVVISYSTGSISGRVFGPHGIPLEGVLLQAFGRPGGVDAGSAVVTTASDSSGAYEFRFLLAATYRVNAGSAKPRGDGIRKHPLVGSAQRTGLKLAAGERLHGVDLHLPPAAALIGSVSDREGNPVRFAAVECWRVRGQRTARIQGGSSQSSGRFAIGGLEAGEYLARAVLEREISPWARVVLETEATAEIALTLEPGSMLAVEVSSQGQPVERCYVRVLDEAQITVWSSVVRDGEALIGPFLAGTYDVRASAGSGQPQAAESVRLAGEDRLSVQLSLP